MRHLFGLTCFVCAILCGVFFAGFTEVMQVVTTNPLFFWLVFLMAKPSLAGITKNRILCCSGLVGPAALAHLVSKSSLL
jgi:hypothetical protein